ncbi:MAG: endonuclease III [Phycisphaerales bacterium]|nr:MAG: endonuclease III [Phycisphaerales bacterium]
MPETGETIADRKKRTKRVLTALRKLYPDADCALHHQNAYQLLVATILSAQSTDETVNKVTPALFKEYPTPKKLAAAKREDIEAMIKSTGFFRNKAKSILGAAQKITEEFGGEVPDEMNSLLTLPGVARKTANVILGTWFGKNEGVVVDTHVGRLATRLGLTWSSRNEKDAGRIEDDLISLFPRKEWTFLGHALIWHGRKVCSARKPDCEKCTLAKHCPSAGTFDR